MGAKHIFLTALQWVILVSFAVVVVLAAKKVYKRRNTYNAWLLPFAYFSFASWIFWVLQYLIIVGHPLLSFQSDMLQNTSHWLGVMQSVLWASAILSLYSKHFSQVSVTLLILIMVSTVIALVICYNATLFTSVPFVIIAGVSAAAMFTALAVSILQMPVSKILAAIFFIYGYFQWFWHYVGFTSLSRTQCALIAFPIWQFALLGAWIYLVSDMLIKFRVMISSTIRDLVPERHAVASALRRLDLEGFRSEVFGSRSDTPEAICAFRAEDCHIFILITGEHFGHMIESRQISVVQFEHQVARAQNPGKILVYIKEGVTREPRLEEFVERLKDFQRGHFASFFTTPEDLSEMIPRDVKEWVNSQQAKIITQHWT